MRISQYLAKSVSTSTSLFASEFLDDAVKVVSLLTGVVGLITAILKVRSVLQTRRRAQSWTEPAPSTPPAVQPRGYPKPAPGTVGQWWTDKSVVPDNRWTPVELTAPEAKRLPLDGLASSSTGSRWWLSRRVSAETSTGAGARDE